MPHKCLAKAYSSVVRTTLEYTRSLSIALGAHDADRLKFIQCQSGRVITGTMKFTPKVKFQEEVQLNSLIARHDAASLQVMHCIVNENAPAYLQTLKLKMYSEIHSASNRKATNKSLDPPKVRLQSTQNSFLPGTVSPSNKMFKKLQHTSSLASFKLGYKKQHIVVSNKIFKISDASEQKVKTQN